MKKMFAKLSVPEPVEGSPAPSAPRRRRFFWIFLAIVIPTILFVSASVVYAEYYSDRIFPGVHAGSIDLSNLTVAEANAKLQTEIDKILTTGFKLTLADSRTTISPIVTSPNDPDLIRDLVIFDKESTIRDAARLGRGRNLIKNLIEQVVARVHGISIPIKYSMSREEILKSVHDSFDNLLTPAKDARFSIIWNKTAGKIEPIIDLMPESSGNTLNENLFFTDLELALEAGIPVQVSLQIIPDQPKISLSEAQPLTGQVAELLAAGERTLIFENKKWPLPAEAVSSMIVLQKNELGHAELALDGAAFDALLDTIAASINQPAEDARFRVENNKAIEFQGSRSGVELDRESTIKIVNENFIDKKELTAAIAIKTSEPAVSIGEINDLGIEGVLGVGTSNFKNSPPNRIKNIKNAVRLLNGILIKPGEEFSLIKTLAPYTLENGYFPEMVIKGDKILPEIGGGLCQIGTTTFRAAMNSGLPITERQNHSLVVSYYNDPANNNPGTDATVYEPHPDLRFLNDTGGYILFAAEIVPGTTELRFTFWGKPDGRKGYYSPPVVDRWIPAGETVTNETLDLPPGQKKCQSKHNGADTHFIYTIERADGTRAERTFTSHYRPLPEICLLGVEKLTENPGDSGIPDPTLPPTTE